MTGFDILEQQSEKKNSKIILGLDPDDSMRNAIRRGGGLEAYLKSLIDQTQEYVIGVKANLAFYERSAYRRSILKQVLGYAASKYGLVTILDAKRGDIEATQTAYAQADKKNFNPNIVTLSPYMGEDVVKPYLDLDPETCAFITVATSNQSARELQDKFTEGLYYYIQVALAAMDWSNNKRIGYVVGSTKPDAIKNIRMIEKEFNHNPAPVLAPGFGQQNGDLNFVRHAGENTYYPISSGLTKEDRLKGLTPAEAAKAWRDKVNEELANVVGTPSLIQFMVDKLIESALITVQKDPDKTKWHLLSSGLEIFGKNNIEFTAEMSDEEKQEAIRKALDAGIITEEHLGEIFLNLRDLVGEPETGRLMAFLYTKAIKESGVEFDNIASIAYGAIDTAVMVKDYMNQPGNIVRKEGSEATHNDVLGKLEKGSRVIMIEDVTTTANSLIKKVEKLRKNYGVIITDAFVFCKREEKSEKTCQEHGITLHYITDMPTLKRYIANSGETSDGVEKCPATAMVA
ncbi:orotidine-5'-phosphate decarboxylase [Candidatus Saccharibacteria bacterium]|nr:orotidine-5'-phosphate decarboxylase [Candidatus Saccharibacteria bacterium]